MFDNIRLLKLDPRDYWRDLLGLFVFGLLTNRLAFFVLGYLNDFQSEYDYLPLRRDHFLVVVWLVLYLFFRKYLLLKVKPLLRKLSGGRIFENRFVMDLSRIDEEWEFQGNIQVTDLGLQITNTPSGCLIKNGWTDSKVWDNFSATFDVIFQTKFGLEEEPIGFNNYIHCGYYLKEKIFEFNQVVAIIFRASSFDDYFMLGIWRIGNQIVFRPHVKVSGDLDIPLRNPPTNSFKLSVNSEKIHLKMLVKRNEVKLYINEQRRWEKCFSWLLPTFYKTNLNEGQVTPDTTGFVTRKIPFKNAPGMFGFRNYGSEISTVSVLTINGNFSKKEDELFSQ